MHYCFRAFCVYGSSWSDFIVGRADCQWLCNISQSTWVLSML